jgi:hypothetical protein
MHPSFEQFLAALRDPALRPGIRLSISDEDAATLLTRADWANDYYSRWIALFPAAAVAPAVVPAATPAPSYGPPPSSPPSSPPSAVPSAVPSSAYGMASDAPAWAATPRRRLPSAARIAIIAVVTIAALWAVAGVVNVVLAATHASATAIANVPRAATSPSAVALPADLHGLSAREYPLVESVFESEDRTIPGMVAGGMTDDRLRSLADALVPQAEKACANTANLQNGFDNPTYKASFIAGYITTTHVTPDKAAMVYDGIARYCLGS